MKNLEKMSDEELIKAILANDHNAQGELYSRYYKKVFHKCISIVKDHDDAFDLAQESLMKAFDSLKKFRGDSSFSTWIYVITHRHCLESLRKKNRRITSNVGLVIDDDDIYQVGGMDESNERNESERIMFGLVNNLPQNERDLLILKYSNGESIESLQSTLHLSSSAIKMRLKRSKEKLNQLYKYAIGSDMPGTRLQFHLQQ